MTKRSLLDIQKLHGCHEFNRLKRSMFTEYWLLAAGAFIFLPFTILENWVTMTAAWVGYILICCYMLANKGFGVVQTTVSEHFNTCTACKTIQQQETPQ